jgi:hypothetical protein
MEFVVDLQGFKRPFNDFTLKELAVIAVDQEAQPSTLLFKPPYVWEELPVRYKSENAWVERNLHGLSWNSGDIPYKDIKLILSTLLHKVQKIYVKGLEKKNWLLNILQDVQIDDLLDFGCPSLETLNKVSKTINCTHHSIPSSNCSANNVKLLRDWLLKYRAANPSTEIIPAKKRLQPNKDMVWCHTCQKHHRKTD